LGQVISDGEPWRLGADEYVLGRTDTRVVNESSHGDMDKGTLADDGIEERPANPAMRVVGVFVAEDHELVFARGDGEFVALYPGEWLEGGARRAPAVGAVTIRGVDEFIRNEIMHRTAIAFPFELATTRFLRIRHGLPFGADCEKSDHRRLVARGAMGAQPCPVDAQASGPRHHRAVRREARPGPEQEAHPRNNDQSSESGGAASEKAKEAEGQIILCNPKKSKPEPIAAAARANTKSREVAAANKYSRTAAA
jgi:hypothetical protein